MIRQKRGGRAVEAARGPSCPIPTYAVLFSTLTTCQGHAAYGETVAASENCPVTVSCAGRGLEEGGGGLCHAFRGSRL